jgi:hypothetical protein
MAAIKLPLTISGSYKVPKSVISEKKDWKKVTAQVADAMYTLNSRQSDSWGGYMFDGTPPKKWIDSGNITRSHKMGINDVLKKLYDEEKKNCDVKNIKIEIEPTLLTVYWSAEIYETKEKPTLGFSYKGAYGFNEDAVKKDSWKRLVDAGLVNADGKKPKDPYVWAGQLFYGGQINVISVYDTKNADASFGSQNGTFTPEYIYIKSSIYKKKVDRIESSAEKKEAEKASEKAAEAAKIKVDYIFGDEIAAKVATDAFGLKRYSDASYNHWGNVGGKYYDDNGNLKDYTADEDALTKMITDSKGFSMYNLQPTGILNGLQSYKGKLKDKIVLLSTGILNLLTYQTRGSANWKTGISSIRKQLKFLNEEGAYVTILGITGRYNKENGDPFIYGKNTGESWGNIVSTIDVPSWNKWLDNLVNVWNGETVDGKTKFENYPEHDSFAAGESFIKKKYPNAKLAKSKTGMPKSPGEYTINKLIDIATGTLNYGNIVGIKESAFDTDKQSFYVTYYPTKTGRDKFAFAGPFYKTVDGRVPQFGGTYLTSFKSKIAHPRIDEGKVTIEDGGGSGNVDGGVESGGDVGTGNEDKVGTYTPVAKTPVERVPVTDPFGIAGFITIKKVSGPGEIVGETVRPVYNIDYNRGATFEGIRFSTEGDYVISASSDSLDVIAKTFSVKVAKEVNVEEQVTSRDVPPDGKGSKPCIAQEFPPTLSISPMVLPLPPDKTTQTQVVSSIGIRPFVTINSLPIDQSSIMSLKLWHKGMVPMCSLIFQDNTGKLKTDTVQDNSIFQVFIDSKSPDLKSIHMEFKVIEFKEDTQTCEFTMVGVMNVPYSVGDKGSSSKNMGGNGLYIQNYKSFEGTSLEAIRQICKDLGVGFNTNIDKSDDKMKWVTNGITMEKSIEEIIRHSYISEKSFIWGYFDYYYCFNLIDMEKEIGREVSSDVGLETSTDKSTSKLSKMALINEKTMDKSCFFFEKYDVKNLSTAKSFGTGHSTKVKYYDVNTKDWLIFDVDGNTSDQTKNIILKGSVDDVELYNQNVSTKFLGYIDTSNVHKNFHYAVVLNKRNMDDLSKIQVKLILPNTNLNLYKGMKLAVAFVNQNVNIGDPERVVWRFTGDWIVSDIVYNFIGDKFQQEVICVRRELSKIPDEIEQKIAAKEANLAKEVTKNPEPVKFNEKYQVGQPYQFIDMANRVYYIIVNSKTDDGMKISGLLKWKKEIPKRTAKVEFKDCKTFPFEIGCKNDKVKDIQTWLGLGADGAYGNDTYNKLVELKYPVIITQTVYDQIKKDFEEKKKKEEESKPVVKEETVNKTDDVVVSSPDQSVSNSSDNGEMILIIGDSQSAVYGKGNTAGALKIDANGELKYTYSKVTYTWPNFFTHNGAKLGSGVDVLALGSQTTAWMLNGSAAGPGLKTYLSKTKKKYTKIIIWGGGNDCTNNWDLYKTTIPNIQAMVDLGISHGAKVYVCLGYKVEGTDGKGNFDEGKDIWPGFGNYKHMGTFGTIKTKKDWIPRLKKRKELNESILKAHIKNANLIPVMDLGGRTSDGLHATQAGYRIAAGKIMEAVAGTNVVQPNTDYGKKSEKVQESKTDNPDSVDIILMGGRDDRKENGNLIDKNIKQQIELLKTHIGSKTVIGFRYMEDEKVISAIDQYPNAYVVLFSAGCQYSSSISNKINNKKKLFIVEPYAKGGNTSVVTAVKNGTPAKNVITGPSVERGKNVVDGSTNTPAGVDHWGALKYVGRFFGSK